MPKDTNTGFDIITPDPYNIEAITSSLDPSRAAIAAQMELQNAQWQQMEATLTRQAADSRAAVTQFNQEIINALNTAIPRPDRISIERTRLDPLPAAGPLTTIDIQGVVAPMQAALKDQITSMRTAYTAQVAVQAKQLDAAVGAGAFGGNSYRAQQAYQSSMNQLMGQTLGQLATTTLSAEQAILGAVGQLTGIQAQLQSAEQVARLGEEAAHIRMQGQITSAEVGLEAQLNAEQNNRFMELQATREVALLGLLGKSAELTVEAGSILTGNWLSYFSLQNESTSILIQLMANIDITEAGIRQQQARDIFQGEMQAITNNANLQIAYRNAAAQEYAARQQRRASKRASQASEYVAELQAATNIQVAEIGARGRTDVADIEVAGLLQKQLSEQSNTLDVLRLLDDDFKQIADVVQEPRSRIG